MWKSLDSKIVSCLHWTIKLQCYAAALLSCIKSCANIRLTLLMLREIVEGGRYLQEVIKNKASVLKADIWPHFIQTGRGAHCDVSIVRPVKIHTSLKYLLWKSEILSFIHSIIILLAYQHLNALARGDKQMSATVDCWLIEFVPMQYLQQYLCLEIMNYSSRCITIVKVGQTIVPVSWLAQVRLHPQGTCFHLLLTIHFYNTQGNLN